MFGKYLILGCPNKKSMVFAFSSYLKAYELLCCDDDKMEKSYLFFEAGKIRTTK